MQFSLIFFSGDERNKYRLVLDSARFADEHRFAAVWVPERHFHRFGGLYPNPSVLGAALALATRRVQIRAGSVVLPLHHPIRVCEDWSVVDNLSGGRVGLALATGFSPLDFVFHPEHWENRRELTFQAVETIREFWQGDTLFVRDGAGSNVEVELHPAPVQPVLPLWLTCTKSTETFVRAGQLGCHVLTALIDLTTEELETKLEAYYASLAEHGYDRNDFEVTLMLHTFVGREINEVREIVREPFTNYLRGFLKVIDSQKQSLAPGQGVSDISARDRDTLLTFGFDKYFNRASLMGTVDTCSAVVERMQQIGVTEIACLMDFGVDEERVLSSLPLLHQLASRFQSLP